MRVLSLGAGVQSSTLLLMACEGELAIDAAIFADTQWEPEAVYQQLTWLTWRAAEAGIPIYRVTAGNLRADALRGKPEAWVPLYARNREQASGQLRRQCTSNYKVVVIRRQMRMLWESSGRPPTMEQLIGISLDECHRMRDSGVRYIRHVYPLVDARLTRTDCLRWLEHHGYPRPPKSACIGCPYHDNAYWRMLRNESPAEWADAVAFDAAVRGTRLHGESSFVHRQMVPLDQADIRSEQERGQAEMFGNECFGVCGV